MVGLPGQTLRDIAADVVFYRETGADMIGARLVLPEPPAGAPMGPWPCAAGPGGPGGAGQGTGRLQRPLRL
jgi:hypothetical protein